MTSEAFYDFNNKDWWTKNQAGEAILKVENIPISHIGTDPAQAADMTARTVAVPANLGIKSNSFALRARRTGREDRQLSSTTRESRRRPTAERKRIERLYAERIPRRARLQGPPAERRLGDAALSAQRLGADHRRICSAIPNERPKTFYLGSREYDPVKLGYKSDPIANGFEFDTSIRGNWNRGHEFRKDYSKDKEIKGVIGPALSADDRKALIEYLKTL